MPYLRRLLSIIIILSFLGALWLVCRGSLSFFRSSDDHTETLTIALYLLSSLAQSLAAILGIFVAVFFVGMQFGFGLQYIRSIVKLYQQRTAFVVLIFYALAIALHFFSLSLVGEIVREKQLWLLDLNVLIAATAVTAVIPLVMLQVENANPYYLGLRLVRLLNAKRVSEYGLAQVSPGRNGTNDLVCRLVVWGHQHGREDPLGPFHEVVMVSVRNQDRLLLSALIRLLLQRAASICGVYYRRLPRRKNESRFLAFLHEVRGRVPRTYSSKACRVAVVLHVMHYVIRRCHNLRKEWGDLDSLRQQFILNVVDFLQVLRKGRSPQKELEIGIFSLLHLALGYADVTRAGEQESLVEAFSLARHLESDGLVSQAILCVEVLAFVSAKTGQSSHPSFKKKGARG